MLIINADDWGGFREGTDAIDACFEMGVISSTTAMVYMADSRRASEIARERLRPTGLHLNLTQCFDAVGIPAPVRERQRRLCLHFANLRRRRWWLSADPRVHRLVADGILDQLEKFRELYDREPTHIDSHHHVHVCPDVFLSKELRPGWRVRQTLSSPLSVSLGSWASRAKHELLARRFVTTEYLWCARELAGGEAPSFAHVVECARDYVVELMTHPSFRHEFAVLQSDAWMSIAEDAQLVDYAADWPMHASTS